MASLDYVWTASHNIHNDVLHMINKTKKCEFLIFVVFVVIVIVMVVTSTVFDRSKDRFVYQSIINVNSSKSLFTFDNYGFEGMILILNGSKFFFFRKVKTLPFVHNSK